MRFGFVLPDVNGLNDEAEPFFQINIQIRNVKTCCMMSFCNKKNQSCKTTLTKKQRDKNIFLCIYFYKTHVTH